MIRPSVRYLYHPERDQVYELYFRYGKARVVSRVPRAKGRRGRPLEMWNHINGEPSPLVADVIARCEANTDGDTYEAASAAMNHAYMRERGATQNNSCKS